MAWEWRAQEINLVREMGITSGEEGLDEFGSLGVEVIRVVADLPSLRL